MKRAFTLIEVNLAILVMAGGILSVVVLYSLGFRETRQSREDIVSAAAADAVMGPLVAALSSTELTWDKFNSIGNLPEGGWGAFVNESTGQAKLNSDANSVFSDLGVPNGLNSVPSDYKAGLVVCHNKDSGVVKIGFRASKRLDSLLSAPLYYTEVRFQGKQKSAE